MPNCYSRSLHLCLEVLLQLHRFLPRPILELFAPTRLSGLSSEGIQVDQQIYIYKFEDDFVE